MSLRTDVPQLRRNFQAMRAPLEEVASDLTRLGIAQGAARCNDAPTEALARLQWHCLKRLDLQEANAILKTLHLLMGQLNDIIKDAEAII